MHFYYIFICLDGIPILEFILNQKYYAVKQLEQITWEETKYIILDFKSQNVHQKQVVEKGTIKQGEQMLTNQMSYYRVDINKAHVLYQKDPTSLKKLEKRLITFSEKIFFGTPREFVTYLKERKLVTKQELEKFEIALKKMQKEEEILKSWNLVSKD